MDKSKIEWTDATWNPLTGCDKVSPGCAHCYAEVMSARLQRMGQDNYANGFALTLHPHMLDQPRRGLLWSRRDRSALGYRRGVRRGAAMSEMFRIVIGYFFITGWLVMRLVGRHEQAKALDDLFWFIRKPIEQPRFMEFWP